MRVRASAEREPAPQIGQKEGHGKLLVSTAKTERMSSALPLPSQRLFAATPTATPGPAENEITTRRDEPRGRPVV